MLQSPRRKLLEIGHLFQMATPGLWNKLPSNIRAISNLYLFKGTVKTYLFRIACVASVSVRFSARSRHFLFERAESLTETLATQAILERRLPAIVRLLVHYYY